MLTWRLFGIQKTLDLGFDEALAKVPEALKAEGFGVLTEIDVQATLKKKLDVDFRRYRILGACNPPFAHQALQHSLDVGMLLPCNVIVYETDDRKTGRLRRGPDADDGRPGRPGDASARRAGPAEAAARHRLPVEHDVAVGR